MNSKPSAVPNRITIEPSVMAGKPVLKGTRIPVEKVLEQLAYKPDLGVVFAIWPELTMEDVQACLAFAARAVAGIRPSYLDSVEDKEAAKLALRRCMEQISEDYWCAGWMSSLEYELWGWVIAWRENPDPKSGDAMTLNFLATQAGGWWKWNNDFPDGLELVPLDEWERQYEAWRMDTKRRR